jgi:hypothetical protein
VSEFEEVCWTVRGRGSDGPCLTDGLYSSGSDWRFCLLNMDSPR